MILNVLFFRLKLHNVRHYCSCLAWRHASTVTVRCYVRGRYTGEYFDYQIVLNNLNKPQNTVQ